MNAVGKPILIIEDDRDIRNSLQELLELEGFTVITAEHGAEGLRCLREMKEPCVILLDLFMPVMDGSQFLQELHKREKEGRPPVVVVSAAPPSGENVSSVRHLVFGFLKKPIDLDALLETVRNLCTVCPTPQNKPRAA